MTIYRLNVLHTAYHYPRGVNIPLMLMIAGSGVTIMMSEIVVLLSQIEADGNWQTTSTLYRP